MHSKDMLAEVVAIAEAAGAVVMQVYAGNFAVRGKSDQSPVTEADERAEDLILERLAALAPHIPAISEEQAGAGRAPPPAERFWLVDPLDGTREFVERNGEFTVNIALIEHGLPILGVVVAPAWGRTWAGLAGTGSFARDAAGTRGIACRPVPDAGLSVLASRAHGDAEPLQRYLAGHRIAEQACAGSSLKFCLIAAGEADLYPRFGRTMEWDTAAGHAVLSAAGGSVLELDGAPMHYGKPGLENAHFVARGWR